MRFNSKELAYLGQQASNNYDREGFLFIKQKNDKLFKKGEAFVERYFRLRGNLLFYFKDKNFKHDPQGVFVLERCTVELDVNEQQNFSFVIVFEGDDEIYTFSAKTEEDRDGWIQALHVSSYECLKMQLQSLREQVQSKTGKDPMVHMMPSDTGMEFETQAGGSADDPAMEISLAIDGLPNDITGLPPNPFVVIYIIVPPQQQNWLQHNHTEMVEKNNNPHFLKTVGFGDSSGLEPTTRVKVTVYHVKERMTGTMTQIGQVIFTLNDLLLSTDMKLTLCLNGTDNSKVGKLKIVGWLNEQTGSMVDMQGSNEVFSSEARLTRPMSFKRRSKRLDTLKPMCENITTRTFQFETNDSVKLMVYEYMAESKYTFEIPIKVLKLFIEEEKSRIKQLNDLGQLTGTWRGACHEFKDICMSTETTYTQSIKYISTYKGSSFKPSSKKGDKELEFVPINLHMQRMTVLNESTEACGCYDTVTVGAFAAHARKFRSGGLSRMLQQLQDQYTPEGTLSKVSKVKRACQLVNNLHRLQIEIIQICDRVCQEALQGNAESLTTATSELAEKVKELVHDCESPILQETANKLADIHEEFEALAEQKTKENEKSPEKDWKWTGSCFVKSPTMEPWDMTRVNTEAALVCLTSMVEDLVQNKSGTMDRPKWLGDISPAVMKLKSFVEIVCQKATHFMSFLDLMEHKDNLKLMHTIKCRRDVAFSHALTSLVTGFLVHVNCYLGDTAILEQLSNIGVLIEMEGLLSCHSDESGMLEDMVVAMDDLGTVTFRLVQETAQKNSIELCTKSFKKAGIYPDLNRHHICVEVPMKKHLFEKLPQKLQSGSEVKIIPVFFNVGINEQQTLAEKFGSTGLQDKTNEESLGRLFRYVEEYENISSVKEEKVVGSIPELMAQLRYNVYTKKSKNVEILHLAAELCRKLHGIRFTCCKSAKDRTAMSVTLEQVQILQREHDLASHVFSHSLDCFRSEGVRRENTYKNIGARKYAFNSLQLLSFPKQYRPPNGTYGNVQN
ncbi:inositol polyphosphate-4-phosphatase type I A-like isoform X2 [Ruditapes philippinarum]|uniref:inositol polyphosphate-4-phosphatase type I A-like isoform X2 n=1 Tax=Ruditapes philippinarum TaxID=129788 RepID=UPI00295BA8F0|nr:inositol polyphosphate-4-phosphatase type I A-like isoform X2 [Ruditapes philippinarum]